MKIWYNIPLHLRYYILAFLNVMCAFNTILLSIKYLSLGLLALNVTFTAMIEVVVITSMLCSRGISSTPPKQKRY
jgi:hypothetical protein